MKLFGITGWKNSGKTGLVERLVAYFTNDGLRVSTIKHAHHAFDVDTPGRDSHRHRTAGAHEVLVSSRHRLALMRELRGAPEPTLPELVEHLGPADLVLIEGFKREPHAKIECHRVATGQPLIALQDPTICAIASDSSPDAPVPVLDLDDTAAIAAFICQHHGLT